MGNKFGWHSGVLTCKDAKLKGDLYVQDDIVFSDVSAGTLGVTGGIDMQSTVSAIGIDLGGTFSTAAINIDGTCGSGILLTLSDDLSSSATYSKTIYSVQTLTGEDAASGGGLQGIRSDTNNSGYDNSWQVSLQGRATATGASSAVTVGDTIGIYASIKTVSNLEDVSGGTGSMCAFKGDVSDSPGSTWDANVHGVMIGYASQINYGGKTSLFFGYTHATAYCDYGLLIDNYSPNMAAGIYLTETTGASPAMTSGIWIDASCTTGILIDGEFTNLISLIAEEDATTGILIDAESTKTITTGLNFTGSGTFTTDISFSSGGTIKSSSDTLTMEEATLTFTGGTAINLDGATTVTGALTIDTTVASGSFKGLHINPTLTGTQVASCAIDVDMDYSGGDINFYITDFDATQTAVTAGSYLSRGNMTGIRSDINAIGNIDHVYGIRIGSTMAMAANTETNQFYGGTISASASGAFTLTLHDGLVGAQIGVGVDSGVTDVTGGLIAALFTNCSSVDKDTTSPIYGIYNKIGQYCDAGINVEVSTGNCDGSAFKIGTTTQTCTLDTALEFDGTGASSAVTNLLKFATSGVAPHSALSVATHSGASNSCIVIKIGSDTRYIPVFNSAS